MQRQLNLPISAIHSLMVVCAILVSTSFLVVAAIADGLDPAILTLIRFFLAALLLFPYIYFRYGIRLSWSTLWRGGVISGFLVIFFWCMFLSLRYTSALNTSIIFTLVPSISGMYAMFLVGERLNGQKLIALFCGIIGAVWVLNRGDMAQLLSMQWNRGDLIFIAGCFAIGLYTPLVQLLHRGEPMVVLTFWVLVTGCGWLLLFSGYRLFTIEWQSVPHGVWCGIAYLSFFTTVTTFFLTQYSIQYIGPTRVMAYSYLYPSLVICIEVLMGKGWPQSQTFPGVLIVLVAMFVIQKSED